MFVITAVTNGNVPTSTLMELAGKGAGMSKSIIHAPQIDPNNCNEYWIIIYLNVYIQANSLQY